MSEKIGTKHGIITELGIKPHPYWKILTLMLTISVLGKKLMDTPGSDIGARCICFLNKFK
jgi:hypothetical protein